MRRAARALNAARRVPHGRATAKSSRMTSTASPGARPDTLGTGVGRCRSHWRHTRHCSAHSAKHTQTARSRCQPGRLRERRSGGSCSRNLAMSIWSYRRSTLPCALLDSVRRLSWPASACEDLDGGTDECQNNADDERLAVVVVKPLPLGGALDDRVLRLQRETQICARIGRRR